MYKVLPIILVVLGLVSVLVPYYPTVGWVLIAVGVILFIVKMVKGKKPPMQPMQ